MNASLICVICICTYTCVCVLQKGESVKKMREEVRGLKRVCSCGCDGFLHVLVIVFRASLKEPVVLCAERRSDQHFWRELPRTHHHSRRPHHRYLQSLLHDHWETRRGTNDFHSLGNSVFSSNVHESFTVRSGTCSPVNGVWFHIIEKEI